MQDNMDRYFSGLFNINGEEIAGDLIYNKENGVTLLNLMKRVTDAFPIGKSYGNLDIVTGVLNSGTIVTLFRNHCIRNHIQAFQNQQLVFVADYAIWSKGDATNVKYNKLECVIENALEWSGLSAIDINGYSEIKFKKSEINNEYQYPSNLPHPHIKTNLLCGI